MELRECRADGQAWAICLDHVEVYKNEKTPEMFCYPSNFTIPDNGTIAQKAYIYAIKRIIEIIRDRDCEACADNLPFHNVDHDLGCCLEFGAAADRFYQEHIMEQTDLEDMVVRIIRVINDHLPEEHRQGLLKEKLGKSNWPSPAEVIDYPNSVDSDLMQVLHAAENLSQPAF